eukprot:gene14466-19143_t
MQSDLGQHPTMLLGRTQPVLGPSVSSQSMGMTVMIENSPAVSGTQQGTVAIYADLMTEVKIRTSWIEYASQGRTGMDGQMVREFGFLQLRMICELIALACLVAHGDIAATKTTKLQSAFAANDIIKSLEKLNPSAFP